MQNNPNEIKMTKKGTRKLNKEIENYQKATDDKEKRLTRGTYMVLWVLW